jgi:hypothetical protein
MAFAAGPSGAPVGNTAALMRLKELTVGLVSAVTSGACARMPPRNWYASPDNPNSPAGSANRFFSSRHSETWA